MATTKIYAPMKAVEYKFDAGGSVLRLSAKVEKLIAFINANANEAGYINLTVSRRKEPGQYGDTHTVSLDTWKPKEKLAAPVQKPTEQDGGLPF